MTTAFATRVQDLQESTALTHEDVGRIVGASGRTVARWEKGSASPQREARQRLMELVYVAQVLTSVMHPEERSLWLFSPNRLLEHDSPAERIAAGDYRSVVAVIEALADGTVV